jgi:hypothetical protein
MLKKIMLLGAAIAAFVAFAAPAANAEVTNFLSDQAEHITAHSSNTTSTTPNGTFECTTVTLTLTYKSGTADYHGNGTATGTTANMEDTHCEVQNTPIRVLITSITATVDLKGGGTGTADFSYTYDITHPILGSIHCTFKGTGVGVTYVPTSDTVSIEGAMTGEGGEACANTGETSGSFTVTDEFGEPASIH